jgi:hypothetical protein
VTRRRLVQLFVLAALLLAPFGRIGMAQAEAMPDRGSTMAAHCAGQPMPDSDKGHRMGIDCMIACAVVAPAAAFALAPRAVAEPAPVTMPTFLLTGIRPEADPPPPRFS